MKNKVMKKILMIMLSSTILMGSASVTAFAQANENAEQTEAVEQVIGSNGGICFRNTWSVS